MVGNTIFSSCLADHIRAFLAYKRALGRGFDTEEGALRLLDRYLIRRRVTSPSQITPTLVDAFLASRPRTRPRSYNHLLGTVRRLFDWLVVQGRWADSPVQVSPRRQAWRPTPFLFDRDSARRLLEVAAGLRDNSRAPLRGSTYHTIFGLLYALGLRVGEVARLRTGDVDVDRHLLVIRKTKFYKSRWVPYGPRAARLLERYRQAKAARGQDTSDQAPLFSFTQGRSIHPGTISQTFHALVPRLNLRVPAGTSPPRVHHLRHSFAVGALLRWYRSGVDPSARLLHLATFLGHIDVSSTAVYLSLTEDLLREANRRFEAYTAPVFQEDFPSCD